MEPEVSFTKIDKWLDQLSVEIVMAEAASDAGQLPIRALLSDIAKNSNQIAPQLHACACCGLERIEVILNNLRPFQEADLKFLTQITEQLKALRKNPQAVFSSPENLFVSPKTNESSIQPSISSSNLLQQAGPKSSICMETIKDTDLLNDFLTEAAEHLENIELGILQLEKNPQNQNTLNSVFRSFHTLKGGAGFLNLIPIQSLAHQLESLLDHARQGRLVVTPDVISLILEGRDTLNKYVSKIQLQAIRKNKEIICIPIGNLIGQIQATLEKQSTTSDSSEPSPSLSDDSRKSTTKTSNAVVKVNIQKLDNLLDMVGEMVIAHSMLIQDPQLLHIRNERLTRNLLMLNRITSDLQKTAMSLRMVSIRVTFRKMNRVMRDTANKTSKRIQLKLSGEDTELDRNIVEEISDPLIHMVRNSVDHGIEPPETRIQAGKSPTGTIYIDAFHQGGNIVIQIRDDGAGLNAKNILAQGIKHGLVSEKDTLSESEIFNLIFMPGFSTAKSISEISGRGVGMDIVKKSIEKLRGKIEIDSQLGKGTTFRIYLPLTLAIIDGLIVQVSNQRYIIPALSVSESFRPEKEMLSTVQQRGELVNVRGSLLPLTRLYKIFNLKPANTVPTQCISVVIESTHKRRCIMVDKLLGKQEVVIKSLSEQFRRNKYLAGAAILGDGQVGLILDTATLVNA